MLASSQVCTCGTSQLTLGGCFDGCSLNFALACVAASALVPFDGGSWYLLLWYFPLQGFACDACLCTFGCSCTPAVLSDLICTISSDWHAINNPQ